MRSSRFIRSGLSLGVACLTVVACSNGGSGSPGDSLGASRLPADPLDWVCKSSLAGATQEEIDAWCVANPDRGRPLPEVLRRPAPLSRLAEKNLYDEALEVFLKTEAYKVELGWIGDTGWRFTGPYAGDIGSGYSYGTHLPVRVYYSPEVVDWLCNGRSGVLPPGATIVKEMSLLGDRLDVTLDDEGCLMANAEPGPLAWATMIKRGAESNDEWYWSIMQRDQFPLYPEERIDPPIVDRSAFPGRSLVPTAPSAPDPLWYPTGFFNENADKIPNVISPQTEYGGFCISCHAAAAVDSTFASLDNILGKSIRYKQFPAADGDVAPAAENQTHVLSLTSDAHSSDGTFDTPFQIPLASPSEPFLAFYDQLDAVPFARAWDLRLPAQTYDHVIAAAGGADSFLTSDQCTPCHEVIKYLADVSNMTVDDERNGTTQGINLSPFGEWHVSPMGVAGRDPIFFAQLEGETNNLPDLAACIEDTCLHCHAVMGQRQHATDTASTGDQGCRDLFGVAPPAEVPFGTPFRLDAITQWPGSDENGQQKYGALARDGVSCTACHRIAEQDLGTESSFTGNFVSGPPTELYGPYEDVATAAMENALGITPSVAAQTASSDLCGSCHNILLPVFDNDGTRTGFRYEQTTHLEWLNSDYAPGRSRAQSCQDCHMPTRFEGEPPSFEVANFESNEYPPTTNRLPDSDIELTQRDHFARHSLHGLNLFLNQMFQQFPLLLGFRQAERFTRTKLDYPPLLLAQDSMNDMAQEQTASVEVRTLERTADGHLRVVVRVTNRAGHFLPSGVGFRRVFVELLVRDAGGEVLWASGRTNELGAIVAGRTEEVLASEQPLRFPAAPFQPHYQTITAEDQVQIYEEVVADSAGNRTTSFLHRVHELKDNRIRPDGYDPRFYESYESPYIRELAETPGQAANDPYYTNPKLTGADEIEYRIALDAAALERVDRVEVSLYDQSIPPAYLQERFRDAGRGPAERGEIERLYYMTSHLDLRDIVDGKGRQALQGWKLFLAGDTKGLGG
jgi:hypothetical protein